jgi:hypothetical protein
MFSILSAGFYYREALVYWRELLNWLSRWLHLLLVFIFSGRLDFLERLG